MNTILQSYWKQFKKIVVIVVKLNHFNLLELAALENRWVPFSLSQISLKNQRLEPKKFYIPVTHDTCE